MASTSKKTSTSSPPIDQRIPYNVFLSFRGADIGRTFIDHLCTALADSGIRPFRADDELKPGGGIAQQFITAIDESRIAIVVFSKNYGASRWCLEELESIIDSSKLTGKFVLPVFYDVNPSDVRRQRGSFAEAFQVHSERYSPDKVEKWRSALIYAAALRGLILDDGSESRLIKQIVEEVLNKTGIEIVVENPRENIEKMFVVENPGGLERYPYEVFLSFGVDTINTFTDHLYTALVDSAIPTFRHNRNNDILNPGRAIDMELLTAIDESRIAIVIFSKKYASSRLCLDELERITDSSRLTGKFVLPVFYDVNPSEVCWQRGSFAKAFQEHSERYSPDKVEKWRCVLLYATELYGYALQDSKWSESGLIKQIVKEVLDKKSFEKTFESGLIKQIVKEVLDKKSFEKTFVAENPRENIEKMFVVENPVGLERYAYDVFLSFRGVDTRNTFTDHLYTALVDSAIHTFRDNDELNPGGAIDMDLLTAIDESRIAIVVFSKKYASSSWCLDELVRIIDCKKKTGKIVLPVFYHVDPSDVRRQKKSFAKAFRNHQERFPNESDKLKRWRSALKYAANLSGLDLRYFNGSESGLIKQIVKEVLFRGSFKKMFVAKHPVGLDSRLNVMIPLLVTASDDVRLIGISGMGGIGKTVIAKALYNETLRYFDSSCFLANIREVSGRPNGIEYLQEQLLHDLSMTKSDKVPNVDRGIKIIKERFCYKKVLIVLDDLDNSEQANALAGCHDWFGPGSRIIITTRHENLLHELNVDETYRPQELNYNESMELVSLHSFKTKSQPEAYTKLVKDLTYYCGGLPLALQVLGSSLIGKNVKQWNSALGKLKVLQHDGIHGKLKISYDGLDDEEKKIFLDIAFFFIGMDEDYVTEILNGCGFSTTIGITVLRDRSLLMVNGQNNELRMHDLIRDMGRDIVRRLFPEEPRKRSRLWIPIDVTGLITGNKDAGAVEGVSLISSKEEEICLPAKTFARMSNLRLLRMDKVNLKGDFCYLSDKIRWIYWQEYPLNDLPHKVQLTYIVALDMQHSKMDTVLKGIQFLQHLKMLNLSHSKQLTSTPDFTKVQNLVTLILEGCTSLLKIHPSIGSLASLVFLNMKDCKQIKTIPKEICCLRSLEYLTLNGCSKLEGLPDNLGEIETLGELSVDETAIEQLPSSLGLLKNLRSLSLKGCNKKSAKRSWFPFFTLGESSNSIRLLPPSLSGLGALRKLILRDCNLSNQDIPVDIGRLSALQELDLAGNSFSRLPQSFNQLTNLVSLSLDNWNDLCSLPEFPSNLKSLVSTTSRPCPYDVFLSLSVLNTRDTFADHLCTGLAEAGIHAFRDDHKLNVGGTVSHELIPAIEESRIAIIVLSTNYATSTWCLDNLVRIIECKQTKGKAVLPIFYDVDQTDVSSQVGTSFQDSASTEEVSQRSHSFAEAFQEHKARYAGELDKVERWRSALCATAEISGLNLQDFYGSESSLISHIIKEVQWELRRLPVVKHPAGLESRLEKVRPLLQLGSDAVRVIGIGGRVGSGKTIIAKALYNETLKHFDASCFLGDIDDVSKRLNGIVYLQNQLLYHLCMGKNAKVHSVGEGREAIEEKCRVKKVLIVLDGLNRLTEGYELTGSLDLYGPGSRIIVTTTKHYLLDPDQNRVDASYFTEALNWEESMELLSWHSFGRPTLPTEYAVLAGKLIHFCEGLPLAVMVLGIYLCGRSIPEWNSAVQRTLQLPEKEIHELGIVASQSWLPIEDHRASLNFSSSESNTVFLRIAYVIEMFNGYGVNSDFGIKFLLDKCFQEVVGRPDIIHVEERIHELLGSMGFRPPIPSYSG